MDAELLEFNGEDNHVHLLVTCPPKLAVSNLVQKLKGKSAYFLRKEYWEQIKDKLWGSHFWSPSYCVVSCGGAPLETVKKYIEEQRRPPKKNQIERSKRFAGRKLEMGRATRWLASKVAIARMRVVIVQQRYAYLGIDIPNLF